MIQVRQCHGGELKLRSGSPTESPFGSCIIPTSCAADQWTTVECTATRPSGIQDLYMTLSNAGAGALEVGTLRFENATTNTAVPTRKPVLEKNMVRKGFDLKGRLQ